MPADNFLFTSLPNYFSNLHISNFIFVHFLQNFHNCNSYTNKNQNKQKNNNSCIYYFNIEFQYGIFRALQGSRELLKIRSQYRQK